MKHNYLLLLCLSASVCCAQIPAGYYTNANGLSGTPLKSALHTIIKGHTSISYANILSAYDSTDTKANGQIWDMYSDVPGGTPPYVYTNPANRCGNYNSEGDCFNREHSWPESWFNGLSPSYTDMFHIYPTDGWVNNKRANYPYGEVSNPTWTSLNGGKLGPNTTAGYSLTVFEPINEYKGDLARGYFYMTTRYMGEDSLWSTSDATNKSTIEPWAVCLLLKWHHQDTVSSKEINRNNAVYKIQHNRNPFIDHPEWADSIFSCALTTGIHSVTEPTYNLSVFPNPAIEFVQIIFSEKISNAGIHLYNCMGEELITQTLQNNQAAQLNIHYLAKGIYIIRVNTGNYSTQKKLLIE